MLNILIVDHHPSIRRRLKAILSDMGRPCVVGEATDGTQALALAMEQGWDVVLLDFTLPDMSGIAVLKRLKRARPDVSVLMLSIHANGQYAPYCLGAGAAGYLTKESAPEELVTAILGVLAGETYVSQRLHEDHPDD